MPFAAELARLQAQVHGQAAELEMLRKSRTAPNSLPVEGARPARRPVSWPLDLNDPRGEDDVEPGTFFRG